MKKLRTTPERARKGETLVEVLVALLVATLATLLLAAMVTASAKVNIAARQKDEAFFKALTQVEALDDSLTEESDKKDVTATEIDPDSLADITGATGEKIAEVTVRYPATGELAFYGLD